MNRNWTQLLFVLVLAGGTMYYLFQVLGTPPKEPSIAYEYADFAEEIPEEEEVLPLEEEELTPELEAARKELRRLPIDEGSVGDKLLNFLLSEKRNYSRELYEFKNNSFTEEDEPAEGLKAELDHLSSILLAYPGLELEIVSHTDRGGDWDDQQKRTGKRAEKIKAYLQEKGIAAKRMEATGYGANYPIADDTSERGRSMNNRTELLIRSL